MPENSLETAYSLTSPYPYELRFTARISQSHPASEQHIELIQPKIPLDKFSFTIKVMTFAPLRPVQVPQCRQLLGDKTLDVILRHYASVQQREAAAYLDKLVAAEEDRLGQLVLAHDPRPGRRGGRV